ncbi:RHS repeat domain-containing protein [Fangia hongkongensis]|uniref:RHS repeat domain-containing protein n=3 Tax=Fangia hongkongensis TaxID=270495 RepID=UPI00037B2BB5|nr:RHS repeat-associated core domain-containing protein [Fangia hongkongensis]
MNFKKKLSVLLLSGCLCNIALATESINYSYSEYNQLKVVDNGVSKLEYNYLSTGQVSDAKTSFHLTSTQNGFDYTYDDINRLVLIEDSKANQSHFVYDALGHLVLVQYQSAKDGLLEDAVSLKYNQKSQLTERLSYLSNTTEIFLYDGMGRLSGQLVYQGVDGQRNVLLSSLSYHYDALGHIVKKVRVNDKGDSATESYVYDQMNQLSEYSCSGELCSEDDKGNSLVSERYHYNDMGSLLSVESHYANGGYSEMTYQYNNDYPDRLVSYSKDNTSYSFSYDQMGNMVVDDQGSEIHYNGFGRIDQVIQPNTNQSSNYYYNGLNELVSVKSNSHYEQYLYSQLGLMGVDSIDSTNNEITSAQHYLYAGSDKIGVFNQSKDNQDSYQGYIKDYAGSILALVERTDEAVSNIVQSYRYAAYGEVTKTQVEANKQKSTLGYNGELTDNATSWQLLGRGTRAYNPRIRQFTSQDTLSPFGKGGINSYSYLSQANPVMYSDPSGHTRRVHLRYPDTPISRPLAIEYNTPRLREHRTMSEVGTQTANDRMGLSGRNLSQEVPEGTSGRILEKSMYYSIKESSDHVASQSIVRSGSYSSIRENELNASGANSLYYNAETGFISGIVTEGTQTAPFIGKFVTGLVDPRSFSPIGRAWTAHVYTQLDNPQSSAFQAAKRIKIARSIIIIATMFSTGVASTVMTSLFLAGTVAV